jgi:hypothetical protein
MLEPERFQGLTIGACIALMKLKNCEEAMKKAVQFLHVRLI